MHDYVVYILRCNDGSLYTGVTRDLAHRLFQHETGLHRTCYTFRRRPLTLVYAVHFQDVHEAISLERRVKRWSRKKKEALIRREHEALPFLSKNGMQRKIQFIQTLLREKTKSIVTLSTVEG